MNIADVRQKFPQYSDLSDEQLAKGLHQKFYADIPYEKFSADIGLKPAAPERSGLEQFRDAYTAGPQAGAALATGAVAAPVAGLAGIAGAVLPGPQGQGANWAQNVQSALTYEPRSKEGKTTLDVVTKPFQWIAQGAHKAGEIVNEKTDSPIFATAVNTALQAAPAVLTEGVARVAPGMMRGTARDLMQSALKPGIAELRTGKAAKAIDTLLEKGINVTPGGAAKLRAEIDSLNAEIFDAIKNSPATVDKMAAAQELYKLTQDLKKQVTPNADLSIVRGAYNEFLDHPLLRGSNDIPVGLAQELKQGTYKSVGGKSYGELKGTEIEAQKKLALGLKNEIAGAVPGISKLNAAESEAINALSLVERRALMDANKNPMGLSLLAANPKAWAAFMADRSPLFKSLAARLVNASAAPIEPAANAFLGLNAGAVPQAPGK